MDDLISRSEAIRVASGYCHWANIPDELAKLPSVTPKHCEDAISRQAVEDAIYDYSRSCDVNYVQIMEYIDKLPSVSTEKTDTCTHDKPCTECPQYDKEKHYCPHFCRVIRNVLAEKTGRWKRISIDKYSEHAKYWYRCDRCGKDNLGNTDWCPNCGAKMEEVGESE